MNKDQDGQKQFKKKKFFFVTLQTFKLDEVREGLIIYLFSSFSEGSWIPGIEDKAKVVVSDWETQESLPR